MHRQPEGIDVDLGRDDRPVPTHEKLVVWGEDAAIEYFEWRFEQGRSSPLQNHLPLLRKGRRQVPPVRAARQVESDKAVGPGRKRRNHSANNACALKETTTAWGADCVFHDTSSPFSCGGTP